MLPEQSLPPPKEGPPRILVVDEDPGRQEMYDKVLRFEGYVVDTLGDGDQVVDHVRENPPDLILLDVKLPGTSGFEVCGDLRMLDASRLTPIILMSATDQDESYVVKGLLCGADDFVSTPQRVEELKARVRVQLRNRRDRELLQWARQQRATFRTEAMKDALTQIPNRRVAEQALDEALGHSEPLLVMMLDVDHFKRVNDTWGHAAGDEVLRGVARVLERLTRRGDTVARFGGEEFILLIRGAQPRLAPMIADRFRAGVERATFERCDVPGVTASVGVAAWTGNGRTPTAEEIVAEADRALYEAKRRGRNCICVRPIVGVSTPPSADTKPKENTVSPAPPAAQSAPQHPTPPQGNQKEKVA